MSTHLRANHFDPTFYYLQRKTSTQVRATVLETALSYMPQLSDEERNSFSEDFWRNADQIFGIKDKSKWLIVHPTANLQRERNTFRAAQLWKVIRVSDLLTLIGTFYSAGITVERPVEE